MTVGQISEQASLNVRQYLRSRCVSSVKEQMWGEQQVSLLKARLRSDREDWNCSSLNREHGAVSGRLPSGSGEPGAPIVPGREGGQLVPAEVSGGYSLMRCGVKHLLWNLGRLLVAEHRDKHHCTNA